MDMIPSRKKAFLIILSAMLAFTTACSTSGHTADEKTEAASSSNANNANYEQGTDAAAGDGQETVSDEQEAVSENEQKTGTTASGTSAGTGQSDSAAAPAPTPEATGIGRHATVTSGKYEGMTADQITASLTLEQKADQMVQPAIYNTYNTMMRTHDYGSILSTWDGTFVKETPEDWYDRICKIQSNAIASSAAIPFVYGQDSVHGVNYSLNTVIFPHNINIGMAGDADLAYQMGTAVAEEILPTGMLWNFSPCVASAQDPRWGRTYESYSSDPKIVQELAAAYTRGLTEHGVIACPKHFFGDGVVQVFSITGELFCNDPDTLRYAQLSDLN